MTDPLATNTVTIIFRGREAGLNVHATPEVAQTILRDYVSGSETAKSYAVVFKNEAITLALSFSAVASILI